MTRVLRSVFVLSVVCLAAPAFAQAPQADEYTRRVRAGVERLAGGDAPGGMTELRAAIALDAARPDAPFYLATALRMSGDLEQAVATFQQAAVLAQAASQPRWQARALMGVAFTLERMPGNAEQARAAWQEYTRFADANTSVADPSIGRARVQAIDIMNEQEQAYVAVRQRIAEREEERRREQNTPPPTRRR